MPPDDNTLTPLGEELKRRWLATGIPLRPYLDKRKLAFTTWQRLLYGRRAARISTVLRYCRAVGIKDKHALRLAQLTYDGQHSERSLTRLGSALEQGRLAAAEDTRAFLAKRQLSITTWYRLLYDLSDDPFYPRKQTITRYALACGVSVDQALKLAEQDLKSGPSQDETDTGPAAQ